MSEVLRSRFRGAFLGCALGDAVGRPFEMTSSSDGRLAPALDALLCGARPLMYSDDTQMMISVAESLTRSGGRVSREELLASLAANYDPARGYGHGMKRALEAFARGDPSPSRASWAEGSKGNGGAVRVVAVACAFHDDAEMLAALAEESAGVTHAHRLGRAGAVAHALAIAHAVASVSMVDEAALLGALAHARVVDGTSIAERLSVVRDLLGTRASAVDAARRLGNGVLAEEAVPFALFCFLRWAPDFASVVRNTVLAGGDTDTTAAMSGALAGALVGEEGLPSSWVARLENGAKGADYLRSLADRAFELWRQGRSR